MDSPAIEQQVDDASLWHAYDGDLNDMDVELANGVYATVRPDVGQRPRSDAEGLRHYDEELLSDTGYEDDELIPEDVTVEGNVGRYAPTAAARIDELLKWDSDQSGAHADHGPSGWGLAGPANPTLTTSSTTASIGGESLPSPVNILATANDALQAALLARAQLDQFLSRAAAAASASTAGDAIGSADQEGDAVTDDGTGDTGSLASAHDGGGGPSPLHMQHRNCFLPCVARSGSNSSSAGSNALHHLEREVQLCDTRDTYVSCLGSLVFPPRNAHASGESLQTDAETNTSGANGAHATSSSAAANAGPAGGAGATGGTTHAATAQSVPRFGRRIPFSVLVADQQVARDNDDAASTRSGSTLSTSAYGSSSSSSASRLVERLIGTEDSIGLLSHSDVQSSATSETFMLSSASAFSSSSEYDAFAGSTVLFAPEYKRLAVAVAEAVMSDDGSLTSAAAHVAADRLLAVASRARCATLASEIALRVAGNPNFALLAADPAFTPPIEIAIWSGFHGTAFGAGATVTVPIVLQLRSIDGQGAGSKQSSSGNASNCMGRLMVNVVQEAIFTALPSASTVQHPNTSGSNAAGSASSSDATGRSAVQLQLSIVSGRFDISYFPGADLDSARNLCASIDPRTLQVMLAAPLPEPAVAAMMAAVEQLARQARDKVLARAAAKKRRRRGSIDKRSAEQSSAATAQHQFRPSLAPNEDEEARIVQSLDAISGHPLADGAWRVLMDSGGSSGTAQGTRPVSIAAAVAGVAAGDGAGGQLAMIASAYTQGYAWGRGEYGVLGTGSTKDAYFPMPIPFAGEVGTWRVNSIACGWYHTVALTDVGLVYSWGSGADGQLGHGDTLTCSTPRLIDFFGLQHPLVVTSIAAGADANGSHTVVVAKGLLAGEVEGTSAAAGGADDDEDNADEDREAMGAARDISGINQNSDPIGDVGHKGGKDVARWGRVYAWGHGTAAGSGSTTNVLSPQVVRAGVSDMYASQHGGVLAVSAGGGFCVALTRSGAVYSWGKYANGRLGLGLPPESRHRGFGGNKRFVRFSLTPMRITRGLAAPDDVQTQAKIEQLQQQIARDKADGADDATATRTGTSSHAIGTSSADSTAAPASPPPQAPKALVPWVSNAYGKATRAIRAIACGESHALAVDAFGLLWAWGHGASGQTGLGLTADVLAPRQVQVLQRPEAPIPSVSQRNSRVNSRRGSVLSKSLLEDDDRSSVRTESTRRSSVTGAGTSFTATSSASTSTSTATAAAALVPVRFTTVAAGSAHSLAIAVDGSLYSWGASGGAALGHGDGLLRAGMRDTPASVAARVRARQQRELERAKKRDSRDVAANLTEAEAKRKEKLRNKNGDDEEDDESGSDEDGNTEKARPLHKRLGWRRPWLQPRRLRVFDGSLRSMRVMSAGGGAGHTWALTASGRLYVWGENSSGILGIGSTEAARTELLPRVVGLTSASALASDDTTAPGGVSGAPATQSGLQPESLPWTMRVAAENILCAGSGGWHMVAIAAGSVLGESLRAAWSLGSLNALRLELAAASTGGPQPQLSALMTGRSNYGAATIGGATNAATNGLQSEFAAAANGGAWPDFMSGRTGHTARTATGTNRYKLRHAQVRGYDTTLIAEGRVIRAHRAILAARSPVLAARLARETRAGRPSKLLLADLSFDTAAQIVEFCYTDDISLPLSPLAPGLRSLANAASAYGITRLELLCRVMLEAPITFWMRQLKAVEATMSADGDADVATAVPADQLVSPPQARERQIKAASSLPDITISLPYQLLQGALLQPQWFDVYFVSQGWRFPAHAAIICSSCEYFRVLLADAMEQAYGDEHNGGDAFGYDGSSVISGLTGSVNHSSTAASSNRFEPLEVEVPDSAMTLARMLFFCYAGWLAPLPRDPVEANTDGLIPGIPIVYERAPPSTTDAGDEGADDIAGGGNDDAAAPSVPPTWTPSRQLLLDLVAADRYGLDSMRCMIESCIDVEPAAASRVLELTHLIAAPRLREAAMVTTLTSMSDVTASQTFAAMKERSPWLVSEVLDRALQRNDAFYGVLAEDPMPASKGPVDPSEAMLLKTQPFPWVPLLSIITLFLIFLSVAEYNASFTPLVPVMNIGALLAVMYMAYRGLLTT